MTTDLNTTFRHRLFYLRRRRHQHVCSLVKSPQPTNSGQQKTSGERFLPLPKCRRDTESAPVWLHVPKYERPCCRRCSASQGAGKRGKLGFPGYFFVCLTFSALDRWGKKTDISVPCPMSRSAKQDLPFVRLLSVVFLSANEFWKSENSREKVHTRCPWLHVCIVYLLFENCKSRLISNSQVMGDSWKLSSGKRIYMGSSVIYKLFYSHGGFCRDKEMLADQSVRGRFLFLLRK